MSDKLPNKVAIIGAHGVGKSALVGQFMTSDCINAYDRVRSGNSLFLFLSLINTWGIYLCCWRLNKHHDARRREAYIPKRVKDSKSTLLSVIRNVSKFRTSTRTQFSWLEFKLLFVQKSGQTLFFYFLFLNAEETDSESVFVMLNGEESELDFSYFTNVKVYLIALSNYN